jgi:hypothetical protein
MGSASKSIKQENQNVHKSLAGSHKLLILRLPMRGSDPRGETLNRVSEKRKEW